MGKQCTLVLLCVSIVLTLTAPALAIHDDNVRTDIQAVIRQGLTGEGQTSEELDLLIYDANEDAGRVLKSAVTAADAEPIPITITKQPRNQSGAVGDELSMSIEAMGSSLTYTWYMILPYAQETVYEITSEQEWCVPISESYDGVSFYCIVRDDQGNELRSDSATVTVLDEDTGIVISRQPQDQTGRVGDTVIFGIEAKGSDLSYTWYMYLPEVPEMLHEVTTEQYWTLDVEEDFNGLCFYCVVTSKEGKSRQSNTVTLTVLPDEIPLQITKQPTDVVTKSGKNVEFVVEAAGNGLQYQWYYKKAGVKTWSVWKNHTSATTTAESNASWDDMQVYCKVTDRNGNSVNSNPATITIQDPTALDIVTHPTDVQASAGETVWFEIQATGEGLAYQWYYKKADAGNWSIWKNHTTAKTSAVANDTWDGMQVFCNVSDRYGEIKKSNPAMITILKTSGLKITAHPENMVVMAGQNTVFTIAAEGDGLKYQWYYKKSGAGSWSIWKNHTTSTTSAEANTSWNGMQVYCKVTDAHGKSVNSNAATITISEAAPLKIISHPKDAKAVPGANVTFVVKASGDGLKYQWYYRKKGVTNWSEWKNHTTASTSATANDTWDGMQVYCKVSDLNGHSVSSNTATVLLGNMTKLEIVTQPADVTTKIGKNVTFSLEAKGDGLTYQWYYKKTGSSSWSLWKNHSDACTSATSNTSWEGMQVYCQVSDQYGNRVDSDAVTIHLG